MTDKPERKTEAARTALSNNWVKAGVGAAAIGSAAIVAALLYTKKDKGKKS